MTAINTLKAHLAINVSDVGSSIEFYKKMLGIEPSKVRKGYAKFDVQNPPLNLTLNQNAFQGRGALSHLGIQVAGTADVIAVRDQWKEARVDPAGRDADRLLLCSSGQSLGQRSGWQRMGSFHRYRRQPWGRSEEERWLDLLHTELCRYRRQGA